MTVRLLRAVFFVSVRVWWAQNRYGYVTYSADRFVKL
nr:MAG TPA: hypothetical protein [Caudoviricetes sp.]